jgi:hypothetical protein
LDEIREGFRYPRGEPEGGRVGVVDMLDPNHNARANYYLVQGDFARSWNHGQFRKPARLA